MTPSAPPEEPTSVYTVAGAIDDNYNNPRKTVTNGNLQPSKEKSSNRYDNVVLNKPDQTNTKINEEGKQKTEPGNEVHAEETIMTENNELYEPGGEIGNVRRYTPDDVIMHENEDLYAEGKETPDDVTKEASLDDDVIMLENDDVEGPDDENEGADTQQNSKYESVKMKDDNKYETLNFTKREIDNEDNASAVMYENNELYSSSVDLTEDGNEARNGQDQTNKMENAITLPKSMSNEPGSRQSFV